MGLMDCPVCTMEMGVLCRIDDSRGVGTWYVCPGCEAEVQALWGKPITLLPYRPIDERWAAATTSKRDPVEHAARGTESTLCGLTEGIAVYRHHWRPGPKACAACTTVARTVDARWPAHKRP